MRLVIQRVSQASVSVNKQVVSSIGSGLFVLIGIGAEDTLEQATMLAQKLVKMRLMKDSEDKMNLTVSDVKGEMLVVSQFTLYADTSGGNRPSFIKASRPDHARTMYDYFVTKVEEAGVPVKTGRFGEYMKIDAHLDGSVTIFMEM